MVIQVKATDRTKQAEMTACPSFVESVGGARQFRLGTSWFHDPEHMPGPLTLQYLLRNIQWMSEKGLLDGAHDRLAIEHLSFMLGMLFEQEGRQADGD